MLLLGGMVVLFICSRLLPGLLARRPYVLAGRAMAHFLPIAVASLAALFMGHPGIAVAIVFGTSVGAMTTAIGFVAIAEPIGGGPQHWRRLWGFVVVVALIVFIAGFKGDFRWRDALAMALEGAVILLLWREGAAPQPVVDPTFDKSLHSLGVPIAFAPDLSIDEPSAESSLWLLALQLTLACVALGLGAWLAVNGVSNTVELLQQPSRMPLRVTGAGIAASLVSLALVLPMSYGAWRQAANGRSWQPMTTQVAILMLNLCVLLPILIMLPYIAGWYPGGASWARGTLVWGDGIPRFLLFPVATWRIDNVILIVVGVLLLPISFGKWTLGKEEGLILIAGYFFYMTAVLALG